MNRARLRELGFEIGARAEAGVSDEADRGATRKALLKLGGEHVIEAVLMGYPDRVTVCVSSRRGARWVARSPRPDRWACGTT